jgi:ABC-type branched-subunit amino acid transport system substrate-binding protein
LVLAVVNCSAGPKPKPDETPEAERPIEPESKVEREKFDEAKAALEAGEYDRAKEAFRLIQARRDSGEVAQLAELYGARAELGALDAQSADENQSPTSQQRALQMLGSLAADEDVDGRVRRAARVYRAYVQFAGGDREEAGVTLADHPDGRLGSAVLVEDRMKLWPVLVEGLAGADRSVDAVRAAARMFEEVRERRAEQKRDGEVVSAPDTSGEESAEKSEGADDPRIPAERAESLAEFARSRGFSAAGDIPGDQLEAHLDDDLGFVRAVVGWTYLDRELDAGEIASDRRRKLDKRFAEVGADLNAIGAPNRASELSIKLATVGGGKRLVIGALLPMSGNNKSVGKRALDGMLLAVRAFRHAGPSRVTLVFQNSNDDPSKVLERLQDLGAAAIVGPLDPDRSDAFADEAEKREIPMVALTARRPESAGKTGSDGLSGSETKTDAGVDRQAGSGGPDAGDGDTAEGDDMPPFVVRNFMDPITEARAVANLAFHEFGDRRAAIVRPNIGYGEKTASAFEKEFRALGGQIAKTLIYERTGSDYSGVADRLAGTDAEVVFIPDSASKVAELSAFLADRDIWGESPSEEAGGGARQYVHYLGTSLWHQPILQRQAATYVEGAVIPTWYAPEFGDNPTRRFSQRFEAVFGRQAGNIEAFAYDNVRWIRRLMVEHGVQTPRSLQTSLLGATPFDGATGRGQFQADGTLRRTVRFVRVTEEGYEPLELQVEITTDEGDRETQSGADQPGGPDADGHSASD